MRKPEKAQKKIVAARKPGHGAGEKRIEREKKSQRERTRRTYPETQKNQKKQNAASRVQHYIVQIKDEGNCFARSRVYIGHIRNKQQRPVETAFFIQKGVFREYKAGILIGRQNAVIFTYQQNVVVAGESEIQYMTVQQKNGGEDKKYLIPSFREKQIRGFFYRTHNLRISAFKKSAASDRGAIYPLRGPERKADPAQRILGILSIACLRTFIAFSLSEVVKSTLPTSALQDVP